MVNYGVNSNIIELQFPEWLSDFIGSHQQPIATSEARMELVIELSRLNVEHSTGGPFGAAVFDMESHQLIAAGINLVVANHCSMAHAEMVAISTAQQQVDNFALGAAELPHMELVTSCEPCAMCFGALPWSGIRHLTCGARDEDARAIGFDEGPKHPDWQHELEKRGIGVTTDICRNQARAVFTYYAATDGLIYNARQG